MQIKPQKIRQKIDKKNFENDCRFCDLISISMHTAESSIVFYPNYLGPIGGRLKAYIYPN